MSGNALELADENEVGVARGGGAYAGGEGSCEATAGSGDGFSSERCDWGEGADENEGGDLAGSAEDDFGADASFVCDGTTGSCSG